MKISSAIGLRHPASASCLGRHLRLAGRCPNNSSLFPPLAAVVVVALWHLQRKMIFNLPIGKICGFSRLAFSREGCNGKRHLQKIPLPSAHCVRSHLPQGDGFSNSGKLCSNAQRRPREGRLPPCRGKMSRSDKKGNLSPQATEGVFAKQIWRVFFFPVITLLS